MFKRKKNNPYNYFKLYLDIGRDKNGDDKKELVEIFIHTIDELLPDNKWKYSIGGHGYGISKSNPSIGIKSLRNKLEKKGCDNLYSLSGYAQDSEIKCTIFFQLIRETKFTYISFVIHSSDFEKSEFIEKIIKKFKGLSSIDYGYGHPVGKGFLPIFENYLKKGVFSVSAKTNKKLYDFEDKIGECLTGKIRDFYELNVWNKKQIEVLISSGIKGIKSNNPADYLIVGKEEISGLNHKNKTVII